MDKRQIRFLLIEDNEDHSELVKQTLSGSNLEAKITCLGDGEQALRYLRKEGEFADAATPDLVILDINLPGISGLDVLKAVKQDKELESIPIVILTSSSLELDRQEAQRFGADSYIVKPFGLRKLTELFKELKIWEVWNSGI